MDEPTGIEHLFDTRALSSSLSRWIPGQPVELPLPRSHRDRTSPSTFIPVTEFLFDTRAGLMLFGVIVLGVLVFISYYISIPLDRWRVGHRLAKQTSQAYHPERVTVPPQLAAGYNAFRELGFEEATTIQNPDGSVHAFLLGDGGRVLGEVALLKGSRRTIPIVLELTSSMVGHRGLLTTSNLGLGLNLWHAELRQVFPGGTATVLLQYHRDALDWLGSQGISADAMTADEVLELRADFLRRSNVATASSSSRTIRTESMRAAQGRHAYIGALSDDMDITSRLERFWHAIGER